MTPLRLAIVGLGKIARDQHLPSIAAMPAIALVAVADPNATLDGVPHFASLDDLLRNGPPIDAVALCTPPQMRGAQAAAALAAGKHVLLEKPLDVTSGRARQSVEAMRKADRRFGVVLQHRFRTASRKLASIVQSGELGALVSASASIRWWRSPEYFAEPGRGMKARDGGGVLITQAIHTLDLFQSLAGPITQVAAMAKTSPLRRIDTEDIVAAAIGFGNGAIGTIDATTVAFPGFPEKIELACEKGTAVLEAESLAVFYRDGRTERFDGGESKSGGADPMAFSNQAHKALIVDFLDAIEGGREPLVSGQEALKVQVLIEALLQSSATGVPVSIG